MTECPRLGEDGRLLQARPRSLFGDVKAQQAELEIGVLYQLHLLGADTGVPIEVLRSSNGRVHVSGTVPTDALRDEIGKQLSEPGWA